MVVVEEEFWQFWFSSHFSDIFEDFFGEGFGGGRRTRRSNNRGSDLRYDLSITLEEAYSGKKQDIKFSSSEKCDICKGSGSKPGHNASSCSMCGGHGQVRSSQGFYCSTNLSSMFRIRRRNYKSLFQLWRTGKKQSSKRLSVTIPKGVDDGTRIRLSGKGEAGSRGAGNGDLYLFINVYSHELFKGLTRIYFLNALFQSQTLH